MNSTDEALDQQSGTKDGALLKLANNTWLLCGTLFLVTGVLGIPLIFYNRQLSFSAKIGLTIAVTLYTLFLFAITYLAVMWAWSVWSSVQ